VDAGVLEPGIRLVIEAGELPGEALGNSPPATRDPLVARQHLMYSDTMFEHLGEMLVSRA
jgi:hypothetical protein